MTDPEVLAEGCSNAIMEYMACGLPVICSDSGGSAELACDGGGEGYAIAVDHVPSGACRGTFWSLGAHPEIGMSMGTNGRRRSSRSSQIDRMVKAYVRAYEEVAPRGG